MPHFCCSCSIHQQTKHAIYPRRGSRWWSEQDFQQLQSFSTLQFRIRQPSCSATILDSKPQLAIKRFLHINNSNMSRGKFIYSYSGGTFLSWLSGGMNCVRGRRCMRASLTGIQEGIWSYVWIIETARWWLYVLHHAFKQSQGPIGCIDCWESGDMNTLLST